MTVEAIRRERLGLVDWLRQLSPSDWNRPSLCAGWTLKHVVAHLVTPFEVSVPAFALSIARHRGVDRAMDAAARRIADNNSPDELVSVLEANAGSAWHPPRMPMVAPLTDVACHSADIRWALEERAVDWGDPTRLRPVLDFLTDPRSSPHLVPPDRLRGVALLAEDQDWRHGEGPVVRGPSLALAMGALGRDAAFGSLSGEGVATLR